MAEWNIKMERSFQKKKMKNEKKKRRKFLIFLSNVATSRKI